MSVMKIIRRIDAVIRDTKKPRQTKIDDLQKLAQTCWQEVIPESCTSPLKKLESDEIQKRWSMVRDEVKKYKTRDQILSVLDWPASGGNFYWVK